jgi:hypothetical protein
MGLRKSTLMALAVVAAVLLGIWSLNEVPQAQAQTLPSDAFSIVVLPDAQYYQTSWHWVFTDQLKWIVNHRNDSDKNIKLVLGMGDIVDGGGTPPSGSCKVAPTSGWQTQWTNASGAVSTYLDANGIPYMFTIGNHDYDCQDDHTTGIPQSRSTSNFDKYFGPSRYSGKSWFTNYGHFATNSNANFYNVFTVAGKTYLVLSLEFYPRNSVLSWANSVISNHPNDRVIIITHAFLLPDGSTAGTAYPAGGTAPSGGYQTSSDTAPSYNLGPQYPEGVSTTCGTKKCSNGNNGTDIWNKLVSQHPNIIMALNGHFRLPSPGDAPPSNNGVGYKSTTGANGTRINMIVSDFQGRGNGGYFGQGYLRLLTVIPSQNSLKVQTLSPAVLYDATKFTSITPKTIPPATMTDAHNQYALNYVDPIGGTQSAGSVTISTPIDGGSYTSPVSIKASTSWSGHTIKTMTVYIDGVNKYSPTLSSSGSASITASLSMGIGTHRVRVTATDTSANVLYSNPINITVN